MKEVIAISGFEVLLIQDDLLELFYEETISSLIWKIRHNIFKIWSFLRFY
jgi:hypothetical protein